MTDQTRHNVVQLRRHGSPATLTRNADSTTEQFVGVFLSAGQNVQVRLAPGARLDVSSNQPWIWIDLRIARPEDPDGGAWTGPRPLQDDLVAREDDGSGSGPVTYKVYDVVPDGHSGAKLILKLAE